MSKELSMNNTSPLPLLQRIDEICDRFEQAWLNGEHPRIENYLDEVNEDERAGLLKQLLKVELELRIKAGEDITLEEYQRRFQTYPDLIRSVVNECLSGTRPPLPAGSSVPDALGSTSVFAPPVHLREPLEELPGPVPKPQSQELPQGQGPSSRYRIDGEINSGGMGAILIGRDMDLGRDIAVKVMLEKHRNNVELCQRFVEEAQIGGQLQHPGIVPVYELGQFSDKRPYFTMKLIKGRTLDSLLAGRQDPAQDRAKFLKIFEQVCQTLAYAHARGVIHRDLKPLNIMVGAFGEVQVMDWGLAKVLSKERRPVAAPTAPIVSVIRTVRTDQPDLESGAGMVMGTWAYMPPEQAKGKTETLDERCDVFGLGSILCVILTGEPAYRGPAKDQRRQAERGDVADAFTRLDACGADQGLIDLAKRCLAVEANDRPLNAGVLAGEITAYLESVEQRLRQAELASAEARAKAIEERKRRRVTVALAASILLIMLAGGGSLGWWQWERQLMAREVEPLLADAKEILLHPEKDPMQAQHLLNQAESRMGHGGPADLQNRLAARQRHLDMSKRLEEAWQRSATFVDGEFDYRGADRLYTEAFAEFGPDLSAGNSPEAADAIRGSPISQRLIVGLDHWGLCKDRIETDGGTLWRALADQADDDQWRHQLRAAIRPLNPMMLAQLAKDEAALQRSPADLVLLGSSLRSSGNLAGAETWFRLAVERHPQDFWINFELAGTLLDKKPTDGAEAMRFLQAALALRPESPSAHNNLGNALHDQKRLEEAIREYRTAIQLDRKLAAAHNNFGIVLCDKKQLEVAIQEFRTAIELEPKFAGAYSNLGEALRKKKQLDEAIRENQTAIHLDPNHAKAHSALGNALYDKKQLKEAIQEYRMAIQLDPNLAEAHSNLGNALYDKKQLKEAMQEYRTAIRIDPNRAIAHNVLGRALAGNNQLDEAIWEFRTAIKLDPNFALARFNLGNALREKKQLDEAIRECRTGIDLDPNDAKGHYNLGNALFDKNELKEAIREFRRATALQMEYPEAHCNLGHALLSMGNFTEAVTEFRKGHELGSKQPQWPYPSKQWVDWAEYIVELDKKNLTAILKGEQKPASVGEQLALAELCQRYKRCFASAVRFYTDAFAAEPKLADDLSQGDRYNAARAAALAGYGQGNDADKLDDKDLVRLRNQSLSWLRADLDAWAKLVGQGLAAVRGVAVKTLQNWQTDPDLVGVRDKEALAKLPQAERVAWRYFWADVDELLTKAQESKK